MLPDNDALLCVIYGFRVIYGARRLDLTLDLELGQ